MSDRNLELALRLKVDLEAGRRSIQQLSADVEQVGDKSADTGKKITEVSEAASSAATKTASANDALTASESRLAAAIRNANDELAARDRMASKPVAPAALALPTPSTRPAPTPALAPENTAALVELNRAAESVAVTSKEAATQLGRIGESAEQQATRIKQMVSASLQQQAAIDAVATETTRAAGASERANSTWRETAAAQSAAMNAHHNAERAVEQKALADLQAAEAAKVAAASVEKEALELQELLGKIDPVIRKLDELDAQEQQLRRARSTGQIDLETFDTFNAKLQEQRQRLTSTTDAMRVAGITAGKYQQAIHQLPAQITDIVTSLATGMPVWMVAIQQGGQISDSFGGVGETFRLLGDQVKSFFGMTSAVDDSGVLALGDGLAAVAQSQLAITDGADQVSDSLTDMADTANTAAEAAGNSSTALTRLGSAGGTFAIVAVAAAAAAAALAYACKLGSDESSTLNKALILTGNAAGTSSDQLMNMAASMDLFRGTQRQASAALAEVAGTGRIAADQIQLVASAAVAMNEATGRAVSDTVAEFVKLADSPVAAVAELNREYNFLSAAVYEQIAALAEQGDEAGAARLAMEELAQTMESRATQIEGNLGLLESAWNRIKGAAAEAWDEMLSVGREQTLEEQLAALDRKGLDNGAVAASGVMLGPLGAVKELWDQISPQIQGATEEGAAHLEQQRQSLRLQIKQRDEEAAREADLARLNQESIEAQQAIAKVREQGLTKAEQKEKAIAEYRANVEKIRATDPNSALISPDKIEHDIARIEARYAERKKRTPTDRELKNQQQFVAQLERQAATIGMNAAEVRQYDLAEKNLTGTLHERAAAALVLIDQGERKRQADADGKQLATIQAQLLAAQGQQAAAAALQIEQQYGELIKRLQERGDQAGLDLINRLINVEQASAQLDELNAQVDRIFSEQSRRESSIQSQQQAGLLSEIGARQQILDLNKLTADQIEQLLPKMRELAAATGDPAALERLRDLETRLQGLRTVANEFANALKSGFETGLQNALQGLATGTMDLQEAALSFINSIASSMASLASQQLAQMASSKLMGMFGGGDDGAGLAVGASAVTASAGALSAAGGTLITGAAAIQAAAASLAAASTTQAVSGAASYTGAFGFASGGQVLGPGTGTSDSIRAWLSNEEVVIRAAVATQAGMTPLLLDINQRGWAAVHDWSSAVRHSTGGLAGVPAPALPAPTMPSSGRLAEPAASLGTTVKNAVNLHVYDDPQRIAESAFRTAAGEEAFTVMLGRNPAKYRDILKL